jgi:hypothetical protein
VYKPGLCDMFVIASVLFLLVRIGMYCYCSIYVVGLNNWKKSAAGCYFYGMLGSHKVDVQYTTLLKHISSRLLEQDTDNSG